MAIKPWHWWHNLYNIVRTWMAVFMIFWINSDSSLKTLFKLTLSPKRLSKKIKIQKKTFFIHLLLFTFFPNKKTRCWQLLPNKKNLLQNQQQQKVYLIPSSSQWIDFSMKIQKIIPLRQRIDLTEQTLRSQLVKRIEARTWRISEAM